MLMLTVMAMLATITGCAMLSHSGLLGRGELGPLFLAVKDSGHLEDLSIVILCLEAT